MVLRGLNLFTLVPVIFFVRYEGLAVIFKTVLVQSLNSNLKFPIESYGFSALILTAVSAAATIAMALAPKKMVLPQIENAEHLRILGILATMLGLTGAIASALTAHRTLGVGNSGISVVFASVAQFPILGLMCEAFYVRERSAGRAVFSWPFWMMFCANVFIGLINNSRGTIADAAVAVVVIIILFRQFKLRYLAIGVVGVLLFQGFVSPVVLASRYYRQSSSFEALLVGTAETATRAALDPSYLADLSRQENVGHRVENALFDYYDNQSNLLNRLSWVGLVDQVYSGSRDHELLGTSVIPEIFGPLVPRFLFPDKPVQRYIYSDWLSYHYGFERVGSYAALSFGLPMEGLVTIGWTGFFLYPFVGLLAVMWTAAWISGWKQPGPFALFFFVALQTPLFEFQSDGFVNLFLRFFPVTVVVIYGLCRLAPIIYLRRQGGRPRQAIPVRADAGR